MSLQLAHQYTRNLYALWMESLQSLETSHSPLPHAPQMIRHCSLWSAQLAAPTLVSPSSYVQNSTPTRCFYLTLESYPSLAGLCHPRVHEQLTTLPKPRSLPLEMTAPQMVMPQYWRTSGRQCTLTLPAIWIPTALQVASAPRGKWLVSYKYVSSWLTEDPKEYSFLK